MAMRFCRLAAFDPRIRLVADSIRPRALSNLKTLFGKLCCTTLRVVIPTTRSVVQLMGYPKLRLEDALVLLSQVAQVAHVCRCQRKWVSQSELRQYSN